MLLPCIYIKADDDIKMSFNGKIKVRVQKLLKSLSEESGLLMRVAKQIGNKYHSENLLAKGTREKYRIPT